jgi:hypothetical protein
MANRRALMLALSMEPAEAHALLALAIDGALIVEGGAYPLARDPDLIAAAHIVADWSEVTSARFV